VLSIGVWMLVAGAILGAGSLYTLMARATPVPAITAVVMSIVWWAGVWIVTSPRQLADSNRPDRVLDSATLRTANRVAQAAWVFGALLAAGAIFATMANSRAVATGGVAVVSNVAIQAAAIAGLSLFVAGVLGTVPLAVYLGSLADWASDDGLANQFRGAAWVATAAGLLALPVPLSRVISATLPGLLWWLAVFAAAISLGAAMVFAWALVQLAQATSWAVNNHSVADEIAARSAEREREHLRDISARSMAHAQASGPFETPSPSTPIPPSLRGYHLGKRGPIVDPPLGEAGADPYDVADDPGPSRS
jgi:hypothetical protein